MKKMSSANQKKEKRAQKTDRSFCAGRVDADARRGREARER